MFNKLFLYLKYKISLLTNYKIQLPIYAVVTYVGKECHYDEFGKQKTNKHGSFIFVDDSDEIFSNMINIKFPAFRVGELIICDPVYRREFAYPGRKYPKWDVEVKEFAFLRNALKFIKYTDM